MYKKTIGLLTVATAVFITSCNTPKGQTVATSEAEEVAVVASSVSYALTPSASTTTWIGSKPTGQHTGIIPIKEGSFALEEDNLVGGNFTMDISGLDVTDIPKEEEGYGKLKGHLKSGDFFDAETYPTAKFEITAVKPFDKNAVTDKDEFETEYAPAKASEFMVENPTHSISGNLTLKDVTKNITFPAAVSMMDGELSAKAKFNIDRTEWNLSYGDEANVVDKAKDKFIYNTVNIGLEVTASKVQL